MFVGGIHFDALFTPFYTLQVITFNLINISKPIVRVSALRIKLDTFGIIFNSFIQLPQFFVRVCHSATGSRILWIDLDRLQVVFNALSVHFSSKQRITKTIIRKRKFGIVFN